MRGSVAVAKDVDRKQESSPTRSDNSIPRLRDEPERQLGSLRDVIGNIRRDGGTPSVESIATQLSGMSTEERAPALLALQQTHGNRYVQRVVAGIQAKLVVGQPGDKYEQEADRVAEQVMRMPEPWQTIGTGDAQDTCQTAPKKGFGPASDLIHDGGDPLSENVRAFFEPRFGHDFSRVHVHTSAQAANTARILDAVAFTIGAHITFGSDQYSPETTRGRQLLAHELTHVIQQGNSVPLNSQIVYARNETKEEASNETGYGSVLMNRQRITSAYPVINHIQRVEAEICFEILDTVVGDVANSDWPLWLKIVYFILSPLWVGIAALATFLCWEILHYLHPFISAEWSREESLPLTEENFFRRMEEVTGGP